MHLCLNKLASKVWKKNCPNFLYTIYTAGRKSESSFSHSFLAVFPSLVMQRIFHSFFKQVCFLKKYLRVAGFLQSDALYANITHDPRSEYNRRESERSKRQWSRSVWGVLRPQRGFSGRSTLRKFLGSTEHLDWLKIDVDYGAEA